MKKLTVKKGIDCQACLSCSIACSKAWFKTEDPDLAFVQIRMKGAQPAPFTCIQCGTCTSVCKALEIDHLSVWADLRAAAEERGLA